MLQARIRTHAEMIVRARHDELVGLEVLVEDHLAALRALHPEIVRDLALRGQEAADLGTHDVVDPVHARALLTPRIPNRYALGDLISTLISLFLAGHAGLARACAQSSSEATHQIEDLRHRLSSRLPARIE